MEFKLDSDWIEFEKNGMQIGELDIENLFLTMKKDVWKYTNFNFFSVLFIWESDKHIPIWSYHAKRKTYGT